MKAIDKLCVTALVLGGIGCAVFGGLMLENGQQGNVADFFNVSLNNGSIGIRLGDFIQGTDNVTTGYETPVDMGSGINKLDFEVGAANLVIESGSAFTIEAHGVNVGKCKVDGGVWYLEALGSNGDITVTIPETPELDAYIELGAGELNMGEVCVNDLAVSIGAGSVKTELLDISGTVAIEVGAGSMTSKMTSPADVNIDCGMGSVALFLEASQDNYNIMADCGLGSVKAGTVHIDGAGNTEYTSGNAEYDMNIDCGMGRVQVEFDQ